LIPSHFPTINLFEHLLDPDDLELAYELESLTNDRLRDEAGDISLVNPEDRIVGAGTSVIMAAFTHAGVPSRFTEGKFGVYYAALSIDAAIAESKHSRSRLYSATNEPSCELTMRCYKYHIAEPLLDIRSADFDYLHDPNNWRVSQEFGAEKRTANEQGLWYRSVRFEQGECVAIFKPKALSPPAIQASHYIYKWDGSSITDVFKVKKVA